jgi:hypothetical protein
VPSGWQSEEAAWAVGFVPCALSIGCAEHAVAKANGMAGDSMRHGVNALESAAA